MLHCRPGDAFINQHICFGDRIAFTHRELLAGIDLGGDREALALVFS
jgi:hypothetical protein